jgi:hypothetical protein
VASVVDRIVVGPGVRGRNMFDESRVVIEWRHATAASVLLWLDRSSPRGSGRALEREDHVVEPVATYSIA